MIDWNPAGNWRPISPSWITFYGILITFIGVCMYLAGLRTEAALLVVMAFGIDRLDGTAAMLNREKENDRMSFLEALNHPGSTQWGAFFDPAADKIKIISIILISSFNLWYELSIEAMIWWLIVTILISTEIGGTIIRIKKMNNDENHNDVKIEKKKKGIKVLSANGIGKIKVFMQSMYIVTLFFFLESWISAMWPLWILLSISTVLSALSFATKLEHKQEKVKQFLRLLLPRPG